MSGNTSYTVCADCAAVIFVCVSTHVSVSAQHNEASVHTRCVFIFTGASPQLAKDTLCVRLVYGLVWLVDVLHGDGVGELVEHPLLESLQPLVVVAAAHKLLVLQRGASRRQRGLSLPSSGRGIATAASAASSVKDEAG